MRRVAKREKRAFRIGVLLGCMIAGAILYAFGVFTTTMFIVMVAVSVLVNIVP